MLTIARHVRCICGALLVVRSQPSDGYPCPVCKWEGTDALGSLYCPACDKTILLCDCKSPDKARIRDNPHNDDKPGGDFANNWWECYGAIEQVSDIVRNDFPDCSVVIHGISPEGDLETYFLRVGAEYDEDEGNRVDLAQNYNWKEERCWVEIITQDESSEKVVAKFDPPDFNVQEITDLFMQEVARVGA